MLRSGETFCRLRLKNLKKENSCADRTVTVSGVDSGRIRDSEKGWNRVTNTPLVQPDGRIRGLLYFKEEFL